MKRKTRKILSLLLALTVMATMLAALPLTGYAKTISNATVGTIYKANDLFDTTSENTKLEIDSTKVQANYIDLGAPFGDASTLTVANYPKCGINENVKATLTYNIESAGNYTFSLLLIEYDKRYPSVSVNNNTPVMNGTSISGLSTFGSHGVSNYSQGICIYNVDVFLSAGENTINITPSGTNTRGCFAVVLNKGAEPEYTGVVTAANGKLTKSGGASTGDDTTAVTEITEAYTNEYKEVFGDELSEIGNKCINWVGDLNQVKYDESTGYTLSKREIGGAQATYTITEPGKYTIYAVTKNNNPTANIVFSLKSLSDNSVIVDKQKPEASDKVGKKANELCVCTYTIDYLEAGTYLLTYGVRDRVGNEIIPADGNYTQTYGQIKIPDIYAMAIAQPPVNAVFTDSAADSGYYTVGDVTPTDDNKIYVARFFQGYQGAAVEKYGFYVLTDESEPVESSFNIGKNEALEEGFDGFYATVTNLTAGNTYYAKPYVVVNGEVFYGNSIQVTVSTSEDDWVTADSVGQSNE